MDRQKTIVRTSLIGIGANVLLAAFKAVVGLLANSISVVLDAVNNLSDALSSLITIIGAKLSAKPADKKHPMGYGRVEYLSSMIIAVIILYAGITAAVESVKKIITPQEPDYSAVSLIIIAAAVVVKIILGIFVTRTGRKVNSDSLSASGKDALMDAIISASVLLAAVIYMIWGVSLEAYLGAAISLFIIKSGFDILRETISRILGERIDSELSKAIKRDLCAYDGVNGAYDLVLHSYGPECLNGSVHIEVDDTLTAPELDVLERRMTADIYQKHNVTLTGISVYSVNLSDPETNELYHQVRGEVMEYEHVMQIHGFLLDKANSTAIFDLVVSFDEKDRHGLIGRITDDLSKRHPAYHFFINLDTDVSD
ncbi:MAG: cation transporter [Ruminococcus sp.]|uniref:cation diffusion facilitator family transporter n=1 Tax=Ruminococcus sp. TaxID=41978 RepID=UPI002873A61E|nr:cation diffusion facilitator family transporter [Ruminococcus sp.]MBQ3284247.1 cation transporter [Ruminococcus sp.]